MNKLLLFIHVKNLNQGKIFQNISQYLKMFQKYLKLTQNISKYFLGQLSNYIMNVPWMKG
jgi:hypothetical protein